jgi:DNA primase
MTYSPSVGAGLAKLNNQNSSIGGGPAGNDNRPNKLGEFGTRPENGPQVEESKTQNEQIRQKIRLSQASKAEKMLVSLLLKSRANMGFFLKEFIVSENENLTEVEQQIPSQLFTKIIHSGARQILEKAEQVYRQDLEKFDKLFSLLIDRIDEPQVLFLNVEEEHEQKLIVDAFKKIQQEFLKHETKKFKMDLRQDSDLKNNLQGGLQQDLELNRRLKEFEGLQKNRLGIKKPSQ